MGTGIALLVAVVVFVFAIITIFKTAITVKQGYEATLERFGKYVGTLKPGIHFVMPFIYSVGHRMNMMEHAVDIPTQEVITSDNATVNVDAIVFVTILDAQKAAYNVANYITTIQQLTLANVRSVIGQRTFDKVLAERSLMNSEILKEVDEACNTWGIKVTRVEIRDIRPPADLLRAMSAQKVADQEKRAAILKAEGVKAASITEAEGQKQAVTLQSEGRLAAAKNDAAARIATSEAEAKSTELVSKAIKDQGESAINYFLGQKYIDAIAKINPNAKIVLLPADFSSAVSGLAGVAEIFKTTKSGG
ncbi:MAG: SPFH domain-containing protein [Gammaproteobacteria bacterium]